MTASAISRLLSSIGLALNEGQVRQISTYIDVLTRWNAHINLTAVREPEEIVTRHFGESLFLAKQLYPTPHVNAATSTGAHAVDVGSGAGFPGLPLKIWDPSLTVTLIESNHKKATFLREVIRALTLTNIDVFVGRAESYSKASADIVTLRAVERFEHILPTASALVAAKGRVALLISTAQVEQARRLAPEFSWDQPISTPGSTSRCMLIGVRGI
jgi:16S rRNA (guanine527-N7)-methyltransferase